MPHANYMLGDFSRFSRFYGVQLFANGIFRLEEYSSRHGFDPQKLEKRYCKLRRRALPSRVLLGELRG